MSDSIEQMIGKALRLRAENGGRHLHHRSCIHNLPPEEQLDIHRGKHSREDWLTMMGGRMPEQITPDQWEIESPFEPAPSDTSTGGA